MGRRRKFEFDIDESGCFVCTSHKASRETDSPTTYKNGKGMTISRFVYEACFGEVDDELVVRHKCDNAKCINPEHLETGTQYDNIQDMVKRGRTTKGEKNPASKLTAEQVRQIRSLQGVEPIDDVASRFNMSKTQVWRIWTRENWGHVEEKEELLCTQK